MSSCHSNHPPQSKSLPIITVNGEVIDEISYSRELQYHQAGDFEKAAHKAGQALVIRTLLKQQLTDKNLSNDDEEDAIDDLIEEKIHFKPVNPDECRRYYNQNQDKFKTLPLMEVSHILLSASPNELENRIQKKQLAATLIDRLKHNIDLFESLATEYSDCPSSKTRGSLGQISKGQTVPEFERQLFSLPEGLCDTPIESRYGYHIVLASKKIDGKQLTFEIVEKKVNDYLTDRRYQQAVSDYLFQLVEISEIQGIELQLEQDNIFMG